MSKISVYDLKEKMDKKEDFILLDVREQEELDIAKIDKTLHIPMDQITKRYKELDKQKHIIVLCHSGRRSDAVCAFLRKEGYQASNLMGGIDAWSKNIDSTVALY